ncbi:hypothetical protein LJK87_32880 [Paenibacillus sp. P25]|nr:hypothetical protein LJK87_32880 [Paenibacillus sp. P25]
MFFLKNSLLTKDKQVRWKIDVTGRHPDNTNAAIDDLRIIRYLLQGSERWNLPNDRQLALDIAEGLYKNNRSGSLLMDYYSFDDGDKGSTVTSSYLDVATMNELAKELPEWHSVAGESLQLLLQAAKPSGFFRKTYDTLSQSWGNTEDLQGYNLIDTLIAAIHLAEAGQDAGPTVRLMEELWNRDSRLYSVYNEQRQVLNNNESPAVYSLAVQLFRLAGKEDVATGLKERMEQFQLSDESSPITEDISTHRPWNASLLTTFRPS